MSESTVSHATQSSSSSGSVADRRRNDPSQQASQIEKSVTHLLVATKQLLETLTQWSRGSATETDVSDVYVRLGYEFNIACRAFTSVGIETADLGPVPDILRTILEETLSQEASQQSLDRFLPRIRDIIINLLHGLKRKQQKLRQKTGRDSQTGISSSAAAQLAAAAGDPQAATLDASTSLPPRTSSVNARRTSPTRRSSQVPNGADGVSRQGSTGYRPDTSLQHSNSDPVLPVPTVTLHEAPPLPPLPPYPEEATRRSPEPPQLPPLPDLPSEHSYQQPIPRQQDALSALQRGPDLERRASRRFSAYQISKHLGVGVQAPLPAPQTSPIPNRGREVRESMQAVRMRSTNNLHSRGGSRSTLATDTSPNRGGVSSSDGQRVVKASSSREHLPVSSGIDTPPDREPYVELSNNNDNKSVTSARLSGPGDLDQPPIFQGSPVTPATEAKEFAAQELPAPEAPPRRIPIPATEPEAQIQTQDPDIESDRPKSTDPLTLFLQYRTKVKKFVLPNGYHDLTIARLQLAFIEKFSWNTHSNGADLPEIYIQDQVSGIRHELEDLNDIKNNSVLVLNTDDIDEMRRHFDEGFGGLRRVVEEMRTSLTDQQTALKQVSDKQMDTAKDIARLASTPPPAAPASPAKLNGFPGGGGAAAFAAGRRPTPSQIFEVQNIKRELAVMRQTYSTHLQGMEKTMAELRSKAQAVKKAAAATAASGAATTAGVAGRAHVNASKKSLTDESEKIINRVDDIQDVIEELRKDVASRGVRPLPKQIDKVKADISSAQTDLRQFRESMAAEKAIWGKVHEEELQVVCDDQEVLRVQEEFAADLEDDLGKAAQTFALVEQASKQNTRTPSRTLYTGAGSTDVDPLKAKDELLGEVRALQPNHESRLEAIERAEKLRLAELETRLDGEFKRELGAFVTEGRLKKSGGFEEVERVRILRDEQARRENHERAAARALELENEDDDDDDGEDDEDEDDDRLDVPAGDATPDGATTPEFVEAPEEKLISAP